MNRFSEASQPIVPVFIHGMWRTGSTYFWHKTRLDPGNRAFLEPLHEALLDTTETKLRNINPPDVTKLLRHPDLADYYFAEYNFRPEGGVPHFERYFSYRKYVLSPFESDQPLETYILSLLQLANRNRQRPVLQFNRALLRAGWLSGRFRSHSVLLIRRPFSIWKSFLSFQNLYFPSVVCMILGQNAMHPGLRAIADRYRIPTYTSESFADELEFYHAFATSRLADLYPAFYELFITANMHAASYADIVVDMDETSGNPAVRQRIEEKLNRLGMNMRLGDLSIPMHVPSSVEEIALIASEPSSRAALYSSLNIRPSIPTAHIETFRDELSPYWESIFEEFAE